MDNENTLAEQVGTEKGNVLVIGNSGVGKSTLINAVLGENIKTGWGTSGTTAKLELYENDEIPFRLIDTIGFEPSFIKAHSAINAVKKWSKESAKKGGQEKQINVIWFCVDGTSSKLFPETIKSLSNAISMWENVPVIVVITKSYSEPDREKNIKMVNNAFARVKTRTSVNLHKTIPVVAEKFMLNDTAFAPPVGITELIDATNEIMPEGIKAGAADIETFNQKRKRAFAQSIVGACVAAGAVVGAVPIPFADAMILTPLEVGEINAIASVYGINKDEKAKRLINSIVEVGTAGAVAKGVISALKAIPGVGAVASVVNAVTAGAIVAVLGEGSTIVFEKISRGEKSMDDIDWIKKVLESQAANKVIDKAKELLSSGQISDSEDAKSIGKTLLKFLSSKADKGK